MLRKPKSSDWLRLYRLYRSAFPRAERKPFWMIVRMYRRGVTDIWCLTIGQKFAGLAMTINSSELVLLDYFAVKKPLRGRGLGTAALKKLNETYYGDRGFFLEVESTLIPAPDRQQRLRRKHFYLSAGLKELHTSALLFGVEMELLGSRCQLDFDRYRAFYRDHYSPWAAKHIQSI